MSVIEDSALSAACRKLFEKLSSDDLLKFFQQEKVDAHFKRWGATLMKIHAVLDDAEEKQKINKFVKIWFDEVELLAYDVEYILDMFTAEASRRKLNPEPSKSKLRKLIGAYIGSNRSFATSMRSKIEQIDKRLQNIVTDKKNLELRENTGGRTRTTRSRLPTTSLVNEGRVYGREEDEKAIVKLSLSGESSDDQLSVVGGLVKTTLAQLVYNDDEGSHYSESVQMNSQWHKGKCIGSGAVGYVYVAYNRKTGALCAMKEVVLIPDDPKSAQRMMQLQQEIKFLSRLEHPNIVQYYGSGTVNDRFYIYLEYVHPGSIYNYVREHRKAMTESVVRNFTRHILSGLAYLHGEKTVHRDIKGGNLLVNASGVVKLADFGLAKHLTFEEAKHSSKGTIHWMAPELVRPESCSLDVALAVDIWSVGCTVIEMLTGKLPWGDNVEPVAVYFQLLNERSPPIPEELSPVGEEFLGLCLKINPAQRPSAASLLEHPFVKNSEQLDGN